MSIGAVAITALKRINIFLNLPDSTILVQKDSTELPVGQIQIENASLCWKDIELQKQMGDKEVATKQNIILENISIKFLPGTVNAIIGKIGSGKSSLLQAL